MEIIGLTDQFNNRSVNMLPSMIPVSFFLLYVVLGFLTAYLAVKKNRSPIGWFLAGMFFGIFGIVILLILPPLPKENSQESQDDEPQYNSILQTLIEEQVATLPQPSQPVSDDKWFYLNRERHNVGPLSLEALIVFLKDTNRLEKENTNPLDVWIWKKGMDKWERAKDVEEVRKALGA